MSAIKINQNPLADHVVANVSYRVRKGNPPKDDIMEPIWRVERTVGRYYEVTVTDHENRKAVFSIIPVATENCMTGGISYGVEGGGGVVYNEKQRRFIGVETNLSPNGFAVVTLLFRLENQQTDLYDFTVKFDPV